MCFNFNFLYLIFFLVNVVRIIIILMDCVKVSWYILYIDLRLLLSIVILFEIIFMEILYKVYY